MQEVGTRRSITGFHRDEVGDWVAELDCGHRQHVRHQPPFQVREWVLDAGSRRARVGTVLDCPLCEAPGGSAGPAAVTGADQPAADEGGDPACWAGLVCAACGAVAGDGTGHRPGCSAGPPPS
ncbi:MAG TPA: DUF3565 domain-containing protein [Acidimicrobiales bacterium]|nr:DUF3565 domain-containing protein [Acidimicrobiales bacterium]